MKKKPTTKPKEDIVVETILDVTIPEGKVASARKLGCAKELDKFRRDFQKTIDIMKKDKSVAKVDVALFSNLFKVFEAATEIMELVESTPIPTKKPDVKKLPKPTKAVADKGKKQSCGATLTQGEKEKIKILRKEGMPIKAIGKAIKRGEKVVSNYVHELEKTPKRK